MLSQAINEINERNHELYRAVQDKEEVIMKYEEQIKSLKQELEHVKIFKNYSTLNTEGNSRYNHKNHSHHSIE